jgi:hypothetical protein
VVIIGLLNFAISRKIASGDAPKKIKTARTRTAVEGDAR